MGELQAVIEAEALFMDALGGEFIPTYDGSGDVHTLARLVRNMTQQASRSGGYRDGGIESFDKELSWAPAKAYVHCAPFEMRGFGRYGETGDALLVPVSLSFNIGRERFGIRSFKLTFYHPALFSYDLQPNGPRKSMKDGDGYLGINAFSHSGDKDEARFEEFEKKVGLCKVEHGHRARSLVTELARKAFCEEF